MYKYSKKGLSIIEIVIAVAIITVFIASIAFAFTSFLKLALSNINSVRAAFLAEETVEVVRFLRDADWEDINSLGIDSNKEFFLNFDGSQWQITEDKVFVDEIFDRRFTLEGVYRDVDGKIVGPEGTLDEGTKRLIAFVSWKSGTATTTKQITTYIADI